MIGIDDDHLGRAARGAARLDRTGSAVADLEEAHEARRLAAARKLFARATQAGEVGAGARAVFEQARLADPEVHDAALVHQIVSDRLDKAGVRLRVLVGRGGFGQNAGFVVDIVVALRGAVDAIGPVQAGVEPLRAVRCGALGGEHIAHLVEISAGVFLGREIAALPAPVGPSAGEAIKDLFGRGLAAEGRAFGRNAAPQERRDTLFLDLLHLGRDARLAEVFLGDDIARNLAPLGRDLAVVELEDDLAIGIANLRGGQAELDLAIGVVAGFREISFDFHRTLPLHDRRCGLLNSPARRALECLSKREQIPIADKPLAFGVSGPSVQGPGFLGLCPCHHMDTKSCVRFVGPHNLT